MMGDFSSLALAGPRCAHSPDVVEEVDRLQLLHPSWLFYESALINMIGGVQAFNVPWRNGLETDDVHRQTALAAPPDVGESQVLTSSSGTWVQMAVGILGTQQPSGTNCIVFVLICTVTPRPGTPPLSLMFDRKRLWVQVWSNTWFSFQKKKKINPLLYKVTWYEVRCAPLVLLLKWRALFCKKNVNVWFLEWPILSSSRRFN